MSHVIAAYSAHCLSLVGRWPEFEEARDNLYEAIVQEIDRFAQSEGRNISQVLLFDDQIRRIRSIKSKLDAEVEDRIRKGEAFLRQETTKAMSDGPDRALDHAGHLASILDRLVALRCWLDRPGSMFELVGLEEPRLIRVDIPHPNKLQIRKSA